MYVHDKVEIRTLTLTPGSFIKVHLGGAGPEPADAEALRMEMVDLQQKCNLLVGENKELRNRVRCC